jgi:cytochrome c-type biogenesis protein CcmH
MALAPTTLFSIIAILMVAVALAFLLPAFLLRRESSRMSTEAPSVAATGSETPFAASRWVLVPVLLLPVLAFGLYSILGDPAAVSGRATITASDGNDPQVVPALRENLVAHLMRSPRDGRGWVVLARLEFEADRYAEAATAYARALEASPKVASDPAVWCEYADALGMAQGGSLGGKPRELVLRALTLNPAHPKALEMAGSAAFEAQDYGTAARYWRQLLVQLPDRAGARAELEAAIARADELANRK